MSFKPSGLTPANLIGNTLVPRNVSPLLRASIRRQDPGGSVSAPFYPALATKKLTLEYTDVALAVQTTTITFASNDYGAALAAVTAAGGDDFISLDLDGFLAIQSQHSGSTHYLKILAQSDAGLEAADIFGFSVDPFPGSVSYAGELASTPGGRRQSNPQGTALIGKDEDLSSDVFNRALVAILQYFDQSRLDLDREIATVQEVAITLQTNSSVAAAQGVPGGQQATVAAVFSVNDPTLRIPISFFTSADPGAVALEQFCKLLAPTTKTELIPTQANGGGRYRVRSVHYSSSPTTADLLGSVGSTFSVWGTPDNKSIFGTSSLAQKDKHASVAITDIHDGNIVVCSGATFATKMVQRGDTVRITGATTDIPFNHNGEFVVETVLDEETLRIRPKSVNEALVWNASNRPTELNQAGGGNLTVPIGFFLPASHLAFTLDHVGGSSWGLTPAIVSSTTVLLKVGAPLRVAAAQALAREFNVPPDAVLAYIDDHIASGGHPASSITWVAPQPSWARTSESIAGGDLRTLIENLLAMLSDNETGTTPKTGADRIGSPAISGSPTALTQSDVKTQLGALLAALNAHVTDAGVHVGSAVLYSGTHLWKDGTSIPNGTLQLNQAIDKIVEQLGQSTTNGAIRLSIGARGNWANGTANAASDVFTATNKIISDLASTSGDGASAVGAKNSTDLPSGVGGAGTTVRSQLDYIAANWAKTSRANTWTQSQTVNGVPGTDQSAALITDSVVGRKLLWEMNTGGSIKIRLYASSAGFEVTYNAKWMTLGTYPNQWIPDVSGQPANKYTFMTGTNTGGANALGFARADVAFNSAPTHWADASWVETWRVNSPPAYQLLTNLFTADNIFTGSNYFTNTQRVRGSASSGADDIPAALTTDMAITAYKHLWSVGGQSGQPGMHLYCGAGGWQLSVGCKRTSGSAWASDNTSVTACLFGVGTGGIYYWYHALSEGGTWSDSLGGSNWHQTFSLGAQPVMSPPDPASLVRCWARFLSHISSGYELGGFGSPALAAADSSHISIRFPGISCTAAFASVRRNDSPSSGFIANTDIWGDEIRVYVHDYAGALMSPIIPGDTGVGTLIYVMGLG